MCQSRIHGHSWTSNFEVDYAIITVPQPTVVFDCRSTDAVGIVMDALSFEGPFGIS